jgi:DNA-binding GntR family transcriptional regulator
MPVREALNQLTAANALQTLPNRSVCVPKLSPEQFAEINRVRQALEGMAAQSACQNATPALVRQLETINRALLRAIQTRDVVQCLTQNKSFHFTLYKAANSELILSLIESLWLRCGPMMYFSLVSPDITWNASQHGDLLKALRTRDAVGARRAIERDIRTTANYLLNSSVFNGHSGPLSVLRDVSQPDIEAYSI